MYRFERHQKHLCNEIKIILSFSRLLSPLLTILNNCLIPLEKPNINAILILKLRVTVLHIASFYTKLLLCAAFKIKGSNICTKQTFSARVLKRFCMHWYSTSMSTWVLHTLFILESPCRIAYRMDPLLGIILWSLDVMINGQEQT